MDIAEWLRELRMSTSNADWNSAIVNNRLDEAANEIERLRVDVEVFEDRRIKASVYASKLEQEIKRLREALGAIEEIGEHLVWPVAEMRNIAMAALKEGE